MEEGGESGGDQTEKFNRNDLCNDVCAGERSLQSCRKNEDDLGFSNRNEGSPPKLGGGNVNIGGGTILCVGDLHWWTRDADLEAELGKYGPVKEVQFLEDEETGKSKGSCHVEFCDPAAAMACKEDMNGHVFNGRPCVVSYASPNSSVKKTGGSNAVAGGNYQGGDANIGGYERGNWGRGDSRGKGNRGPAGPTRNRGRGGFGQGIGSTPHWWFGAPMGRTGTYGGFHGAPGPPFSGFQSSFPPVGGIDLRGVARYINPGFFHYGMPMNAMGGMMMPRGGVEGRNMGMWSDPSMGGSGGGRAGEPSLGKEAASGHQYGGEASHNRGRGLQNTGASESDRDMPREKDAGHDHDLTERRHRDDRDVAQEWDRERERHDRGGGLQNTCASERRNDRDMPREKDVRHYYDLTERRHRVDWDVAWERGRERDRDREHDQERERDRYTEARDRYTYHNRHRDREPRPRSRHADYGRRRRPASK